MRPFYRRLPFIHGKEPESEDAAVPAVEPEPEPAPLDPSHLARVFEPPTWLRDLGFMAWFLVGLLALLVGLVWILGITSTIVDPVAVGAVVAVVASPLVGWLQRHHIPRGAGSAIVLLSLLAVIVLAVGLVIGGIVDQSGDIKSSLDDAVNNVQGWFHDADANSTAGTRNDVMNAVSGVGHTFLQGLARGSAA